MWGSVVYAFYIQLCNLCDMHMHVQLFFEGPHVLCTVPSDSTTCLLMIPSPPVCQYYLYSGYVYVDRECSGLAVGM